MTVVLCRSCRQPASSVHIDIAVERPDEPSSVVVEPCGHTAGADVHGVPTARPEPHA